MPHVGNRYDEEDNGFHNGLAVRYDPEKQRAGFIDTAGNWVIEPKYFGAHPFYDEVAVAITSRDPEEYEMEAVLIDRNGKKVASLPDARCYSQAENGRVFAQDPGAKNNYGYLLDYKGKKIAKLPGFYCQNNGIRLKWIDDRHFLLGNAEVFNADGQKVRFGNYPFAYNRPLYTDREKGLLYVRGYDDSPRSLAQLKQMEESFYGEVGLRPLGNAIQEDLKEPDFHYYEVTRLYADESWQSGNRLDYHLVPLVVGVKARDGRSVRDPQVVLATAGCRPPSGMKFIAETILYPDDRKKSDTIYENYKDWLEDVTGEDYIIGSSRGIPCNTYQSLDGQVPRPTATKP